MQKTGNIPHGKAFDASAFSLCLLGTFCTHALLCPLPQPVEHGSTAPPCKPNIWSHEHSNAPSLHHTGYQVPDSLGRLTQLRLLRLEENPHLRGPIPAPLASRPDCAVRADELVMEDTEATMLGSKLDEWFLMPRKVRQPQPCEADSFAIKGCSENIEVCVVVGHPSKKSNQADASPATGCRQRKKEVFFWDAPVATRPTRP